MNFLALTFLQAFAVPKCTVCKPAPRQHGTNFIFNPSSAFSKFVFCEVEGA